MNKDVIAWLNSPSSDKWRERTFRKLYALISVKEDLPGANDFDFFAVLWRG